MWINLKKYIICFFIFLNSLYCKETKIIGLILGHNDAPFLKNSLHSVAQCVDEILYLDNQSTDQSVALVKAEASTCKVVKIIENTQSVPLHELYQQLLDEGRKQGGTHFLLLHADELLTASLIINNDLKNTIHNLQRGESLHLPLIFMGQDYTSYFVQENVRYLGCAFADNQSACYEQTIESRVPSRLQGKQWYWQDEYGNGLMIVQANRLKKEALQACLTKIKFPDQSMDFYNAQLRNLHLIKNEKVVLAPHAWLQGYETFFQRDLFLVSSAYHEDAILKLCHTYGIDYFIDIAMWDVDWHFDKHMLVDSDMKSQYQQDQLLYTYFFKKKKNGFFVDIGAHDGIKWSNSYFFEKKLGWKGMCIEPLQEAFKDLTAHRSAVCINACVGNHNGTADFFNVHGAPEQLSGLVDSYHPLHLERMKREVQEDKSNFTVEKVSVCTLNTLLDQYGITSIDFISLDTEGSEMQILEGIDFEKIYIKVMTIENMFYGEQLKNFMATKGFQLVTRLGNCDDVYVNTKKGFE